MSVKGMLVAIGEALDREVVDETDTKAANLFWADYLPGQMNSASAEEFLKHLTDQSGITFALEPRMVDYWAVVPDSADGVARASTQR